MDLKEVLKQFNLNQKEISIYLATLELGEANVKNITKKAGIQRTYFYDLSENLIRIGLLCQIKKGKKRLFSAMNPDKLLGLQEERLQQLKKAIPQLKAIHNTKGQKPKIFYYEGLEGINQILNDTLLYKGEILNLTTPRCITVNQQKFSQEYIQKRVLIDNRARVIGELSPEIINLKEKDKNELRETRMLPKEIYNSEVEFGIYGNRIYVTDYKEEFGFIIEGSEIAKAMKMIFEIIWNSKSIIK